MTRSPTPGLPGTIADAALQSFIRRGYARTRLADVADRAGVSVGTLYLYATGKDALFELAVRLAFDGPDGLPDAYPHEPSVESGWIEDLWLRLMRTDPLAGLRRALATPSPAGAGPEFESLLRGLYAWQTRFWRALRLIESCSSEWPELFLLFYKQFRREALELTASYLDARAATGAFNAFPDSRVAARVLMEIFAFFTMHVHTAPDSDDLAEQPVEETVVAMLVHAFVRDPASALSLTTRRAVNRGERD